jgi:hypothetical protein
MSENVGRKCYLDEGGWTLIDISIRLTTLGLVTVARREISFFQTEPFFRPVGTSMIIGLRRNELRACLINTSSNTGDICSFEA